jgi:hypothetical protein
MIVPHSGVGIFWRVPAEFCWCGSFAGTSQNKDAPANINPNILSLQSRVVYDTFAMHMHTPFTLSSSSS